MNITLLLAPAAAGKTEAVLDALREPRRGRALLLLPSDLQQKRLKERLGALPRTKAHQFYSLATLVLRSAGSAAPALSGTMQTLLLRRILRKLVAEVRLPLFAPVAHKSGFLATVAALIAEAQQAELEPQALIEAGVTPYDDELGTIYAAYNAALVQLGRADAARRLALARDALRTRPGLLRGVALLAVDGFDQFTPLQLSLLAEVARQVPRTVISLTGDAEERPAQHRFARTRAELTRALGLTERNVRFLSAASPRPAPLAHIERQIFKLDLPPPIAAQDTLTLIDAADREREVRAALRRAHGLLQTGIPAEQIAVLFRDGALYGPLLREIAAEYELPLALYEGLPLVEAPPIVAMMTLLRLPLEDYPRRALVDSLRFVTDGPWQLAARLGKDEHPLTLTTAIPLLDRVARSAGVSGGLERLRAALTRLAEAEAPSADDEPSDAITPVLAAALLQLLDAFAAWLAPPEFGTTAEYSAWLTQLLDLTLWMRHASNDEPHAAQRTPQARLAALLNELTEAATILDEPPTSYRAFITALSAALAAARYGRADPAPGQIAALPVLAARGACFDHVILLGLAEGEFPLRLPEPPIYTRRERALLAACGLRLTPPDPADERSLFYEALTRARRSLTLSRTRLDPSGNELPPSPYLNALLELFEPGGLQRLRITAGSAPTLEEAVSPQERLIAMAVQDMLRGANAQTTPAASAAADPTALLQHVQRAIAVERHREANDDYGPFEGLVDDPQLVAAVAQQFGPQHHWSVTQFNDYITCPFRFAAAHVLRLNRPAEPEAGLDLSKRGRLSHQILAEAGKQWRQLHLTYSDDNAQALLDALHTAADAVLQDAPTRYGFHADAFWGWEQDDLRRRLVRALRRVLKEGGEWSEFRAAQVEVGFGTGTPRRYDPLRVSTPLGEVLVAGRVDRIDQRDSDKALALIDYKSSSTPRALEETLNGRDVQLAVYLLAVEEVIARSGQRVERAAFLHLGSGKRSKALTAGERDQALAAMRARVAETVAGVRAGRFTVRPRDECPTTCAYGSICRLNLRKRNAHDSAEQD